MYRLWKEYDSETDELILETDDRSIMQLALESIDEQDFNEYTLEISDMDDRGFGFAQFVSADVEQLY